MIQCEFISKNSQSYMVHGLRSPSVQVAIFGQEELPCSFLLSCSISYKPENVKIEIKENLIELDIRHNQILLCSALHTDLLSNLSCALCKVTEFQLLGSKLVRFLAKGTSINDVLRFSMIFDLPTMSDNFYHITSDLWESFWTYLP